MAEVEGQVTIDEAIASLPQHPKFDGKTYDPIFDEARLKTLLGKVYSLMSDGRWRTLSEISDATGGSEASVSARLRDLRKEKFGSHTVQRKRIVFMGQQTGTWAYKLGGDS